MSTHATFLSRVDEVLTLLATGSGRRHIVAYAARKGWNVSAKQVERYMREATAILKGLSDTNREAERGKAIAVYDLALRSAVDERDWKLVTTIQKEKCTMLGLNEPTRNEHSGPAGGPIQLSNLSDEEVEKRALAILTKRQ